MQTYLELILKERDWSWTLMGIVYLGLALLIRHLFLQSVLREAKALDPECYGAAKRLYLKHSLPGWILFFASFLLVIGAWIGWKERFVLSGPLVLFSFLLPFLFLLSVILHLRAFTKAFLASLQQRLGVEKEF